MKQAEHTSPVSNLRARLDEIRDQGGSHRPLEWVIAPLAAILLLRWADHVDAEQEAVADFDGHDYRPALPRAKHWTSWSDLRGESLLDFLRGEVLPGLRDAPSGMLGQTLQRLVPVVESLVHASPKTIGALVQWGQDFDLETISGRQAAGDALAVLVEQASGIAPKMWGEYTTPRPVVELMVDLLGPSPGERIYDPCFGTGGLLATVASRLREKALQMPPKVWTDVQHQSVFGVEINPSAYSVGLARVVLAGIEHPGLELGDALERPMARDRSSEGFECILAVPPWGGRVQPEIAAHFPVPATNLETLFLQHVMGSLRRGGRAVIALPEGALFRTGPDRMVRKELLSDYCVEGVISLPAGAFQPYTGIKTSLVLFRRERAKQAVRFLQVQEWPSPRPDDALSRDKAIAVAHSIADEYRSGVTSGSLWEAPVKKLATRDWELVAKRTGEEALSRSLRALREAEAEIVVLPLSEVAEVFAGVTYGKSVTTLVRTDPSVFTGLVRVGDVTPSGAPSPSLFLTRDASPRVKPKHRLRAGDILLTKSGTIGKLGIVSKSAGAIGAVAAKSLVVLRPGDRISPQFLKCLLASDAYQKWFSGHARGATIQHLSVRTLRHIPVPVPELPIQERVVQHVTAESTDPLGTLVRILTDSSQDPVLVWLEESSYVQELRQSPQATDPLVILERITNAIGVLRNLVAHSQVQTMPILARWLMHLAEAAANLRGLKQVPEGSGRMAILGSAKLHLEHAESALGESSLPAINTALEVTLKISRIVERELELILEDLRIEPTVEPNAVVAGIDGEVQVRLKNLSSLAIRNLSVTTTPDVGSTRCAYLAEGQSLSISAKIPAQPKTGTFRFQLKWQADRLDGRPVSGEVPLAVDVRSTRQAVRLAELGTSPYIVGSPIDREEMFFGRQDIIDKIQRQLPTSHRANVILLEGNRRTGKTSILRRLQAPNVLQGWIVVNCSFQGGEGHENKAGLPTNEVFRLMARDIGWAAHDAGLKVWFPDMDPPDPGRPFKVEFLKGLSTQFSSTRPFEVFESYLQAVLEAASPRRLLLMLDEFDKLQEGIDAGITSPQVPENIRYLLHTYSELSAILTGSRRLKRLREEYWSALFGLGHRIPVSELPMEDARLLVTRPVDGRLTYVPEATDRVVELCARQPFLIQSLCNRVFERAALSNERTITVSAVDTAAKVMVQDNEHFRTLWGYAGSERSRLVLALCQRLEGEPDPITLSLLETKLEEHGIALPRDDRLGVDVERLRELELLELRSTTRGSAYVLAVPLMADWIRLNIDFQDQRQKAVRKSEEWGVGDTDGYDERDFDRGMPGGSGDRDGHRDGFDSSTPEDER
ncbi:MAG: N-6 DNA methylase [Planctomycetota bacterium]|nr:N-6 DNA methylase [Planctomycetota bacterium]